MILTLNFMAAALTLLGILLSDILYALVDPRIRLGMSIPIGPTPAVEALAPVRADAEALGIAEHARAAALARLSQRPPGNARPVPCSSRW